MAHELDFTTGRAAIAYRGDTPWHGYGFVMDPNESLESWVNRAGLDYSVNRRPVFALGSDGQTKVGIPNMRALVRSDNDKTLSIVGERYKVVQPREVVEFFRNLVEAQGFELETAGALSDGKRVWALAKTGKEFKLPGVDDHLLAYLLLATSYDKTFATTAQFTSVRVVCNNTLSFSIDQGLSQNRQSVFRVPHQAEFNATEVQGNLGLLGDSWGQFTDQVEQLANTPVSKKQAVEFFMELMGYDEEDPQYASENLYGVKKLVEAYQSAPGAELASSKGTAWGLVNAVTYFSDHSRRARDNGTRVNSAWFGQSATLKRKAFDKALTEVSGLAEAA